MSALRRLLPDFEAAAPAGRRAPLAVWVGPPCSPEPPADDEAEPPSAPTEVDRIAEAVAAALAGAERERAAAEAVLAASHASALAEARARWAAAEGAALAEGFRAAVEGLGEALGTAAAEALAPLVDEAGRALAALGLRDAVADLVRAGTAGTLAVSGPADLLEALEAALGAAGIASGAVSFAASGATEVTVTAGDSRVETRLAAWTGALRRRLPDARGGEPGRVGRPGSARVTDEERA